MYCDHRSIDCKNPIDFTNSDLSIDQNINNLDTGSCALNAIFATISEQLSSLLGSNVNIDIDKFISCNHKIWNKTTRIGTKTVSLYPGYSQRYLDIIGKCLLAAGYTQNQVNVFLERINKIRQIQCWLLNIKRTGAIEDNFDKNKNRKFNLPIRCESDIQTYSSNTLTDSETCDKDCSIQVELLVKYASNTTLKTTRLSALIELLCKNGPLICNFTFANPEFKAFYNNAKASTDPEDAVYEWTPGTSLSDIADKNCPFSHTVVLVGYECLPDDENPTHYLFKFKDSYKYGNNGNYRDGYFFIKIPENSITEYASDFVPWNIGDTYSIEGPFRIYGVVVNPLKTNDQIQQLLESCCPTPTPTKTETATEFP